jgi:hypothetical protein
MTLLHVIKQMNTEKLLDVHRLLRMNLEAAKLTVSFMSLCFAQSAGSKHLLF